MYRQALVLGGLYLLISIILGYVDFFGISLVSYVVLLGFIVININLFRGKDVRFLQGILDNNKIVGSYLIAVGWIAYLFLFAEFAITIIGLFYDESILQLLLYYLNLATLALVLISLICQSYILITRKH